MGEERIMKTMINYAEGIYQAIANTSCGGLFVNEGIDLLVEHLRNSERVFLIGNGGSGAACDHMANDLCLAGARAQSLTNTNNITCAANDFGFASIFAKQLSWLANPVKENTLLIALSCSGKSENILEAVKLCRYGGMHTVTFSGFNADNPLAAAGHLNFHVPSNSYGIVQLAHEALIHCAIDKLAGIY